MPQELSTADLLDPNPDIRSLFCYYNDLYFDSKLQACTVDWSTSRMTLCAGICKFSEGGGCEIRLSEPLLKYRSSSELKETLLHEMIHAYLWLTNNNQDHDDHGPCFQALMQQINTSKLLDQQRPESGYNITVFHHFTSEVNNYRRHHWKCSCCGDIIKRAMNRPPSRSDCIQKSAISGMCENQHCHWHSHQRLCGAEYEKIAEPAGYVDRRKKSSRPGKLDAEVSELSADNASKVTGGKKKPTVIELDSDKYKDKGEGTHVRVSKNSSLENFFSVKKELDKQEEPSTATAEIEACEGKCSDNSSQEEGGEERAKRRKGDQITKTEGEGSSRVANGKSTILGKRQTRTRCEWPNDCTVIIGWKGWCAIEGLEDEEGVEALVNKRRQRRMLERAWELQHGCKAESDVKPSEVLVQEASSTVEDRNATDIKRVESGGMPACVTSLVSHAEELMPVNMVSQQVNNHQLDMLEWFPKHSQDLSAKEAKGAQPNNEHLFFSPLSIPVDSFATKSDADLSKHKEEDSKLFNLHLSRQGTIVMESGNLISSPQESNNPEALACASTSSAFQESDAARVACNPFIESSNMETEDKNEEKTTADMPESESRKGDIETVFGKGLPVDDQTRIGEVSAGMADSTITKTDGICERGGKRLGETREQLDGSDAEFPVICPICSVVFRGNIEVADFNTQFNEHIDACMKSHFE